MNKAIIIGSGIAGLATAARLLSKGYDVSIFEAGEETGGKIHSFNLGKYRFDAGPSLFTLPHLVDELFENLGENPRDHFNYIKKKVHCQYFWNDGNTLTAFADVDRFSKEVKKKFGVEPKLIQQYLLRSKKKYDLTEKIFLTKSLHSLSTYFSKDTLKAIFSMNKLDIFKSLHATNERLINEPHLIQLYDRYATYNGSNPYETSGIMSMIQHLESHYGTWVPKGGMVEISRSITDLLKRKGAKIFLNSKVEEITTSKNAVSGIIVNGEQIKADYAISNMDVYYSYEKLLSKHKTPKNVSKAERSSSALIFYWGIKKTFENLDLHNILFSENYQQEFEEIFKRGRISSDPTVYINITSKDISNDAPTGCENWFVMVNAPHDQGQNWNQIVTELKRVTIQKINRLLDVKIENYIEVEKVYTPKTIEQITRSYRGSLYGTSSNSRFSAFLRHPNHTKKIKNLYFCGGSVHPGGGIPLCLLSSKIVSGHFPNASK